jgi:hypothetical protein
MPADQQFRIGTEVRCSDGEVCGEIRYLAVNPAVPALTELAVEEKGRQGLGRLVPVGRVQPDPGHGLIEFLGSMADFRQLEPADATEFAPAPTAGYDLYGPEPIVEEPEYAHKPGEQVAGSDVPGTSYTETFDLVPPDAVQIRRHDQVHVGDHEFGQVQGVLVDPVHHRITRVLVQVGHLLGRKEVAIPIDDVAEPFGVGGIWLKISRGDAEDLPRWDSDYHSGRAADAGPAG